MFKPTSKFDKTLLTHKLTEDRNIVFDSREKHLKYRKGEFQIAHFKSVEDTKGNNGQMGQLSVTNLRVVWVSNKARYINLSIGYDNINNIYVKSVNSKLRGGEVQSLTLLCQSSTKKKTKYEFQFTILTDANSGLKDSSIYNVLKTMQAAYESTRYFREIKLRAMGITQPVSSIGQSQGSGGSGGSGHALLKTLPGEKIVSTYDSIWSLSSESGNLGQMILTNLRVVWIAKLIRDYSMTVPLVTIARVSIRASKFDRALVIETFNKTIQDNESLDGYTLGYRIDSQELMETISSEIQRNLTSFRNDPIFGVDLSNDPEFANLIQESKIREGFIGNKERKKKQKDNDGDDNFSDKFDEKLTLINESEYIDYSVKAKNYEVHQGNDDSNEPVKYFFCEELGVAVQELQPGQALSSLWTFDLPDVDCTL